jgi:hypothetical protein
MAAGGLYDSAGWQVMTNYQFTGPARVCAASGRELKAGEPVFSVLRDEGGQFVRTDYAADAWPGPPTGAVAWWAGRVPEAGRPAKPTINDDLLVDCFEHLAGTTDPARQRFRYVVALLLMRRKRFKFDDARKRDDRETLVVRDAKSGRKHELVDPQLTEPEMDAVRDEVFRVLGWE